ncbi:MAG TPA: MarR family winged helix-turn-helix transcriptional regulator [Chryseolinea sp.]|nr:MarR family winged helix-turn-helix transcriptional regulator [Chryseolinea sp.]
MSYHLGNLEEAVLLITMYLDEVYGVSVADEYKKQTKNGISIPAIHTVLRRLEDKGLLKSRMGESSPERGGRRKRLYEPTAYSFNIIRQIKKERLRMWSKIPELGLNKNG